MAVELPLDTDKYKEWRCKQITGLKVIKGAILELIRGRLTILGKPRDSIKDLLDLIRLLYTA